MPNICYIKMNAFNNLANNSHDWLYTDDEPKLARDDSQLFGSDTLACTQLHDRPDLAS